MHSFLVLVLVTSFPSDIGHAISNGLYKLEYFCMEVARVNVAVDGPTGGWQGTSN